MFDYVKMATMQAGLADELLLNQLLNFTSPVNTSTGEITNPIQSADYKNMKFFIYPSGRVEIKGSIHKYWNDGKHNYNDFDIASIRSTIKDLQNQFNINPDSARLSNLEVGLNVVLPFAPGMLLKGLIAYNNYPLSNMKIKGKWSGKEVCLQQYRIKIYNKGLQYARDENILRFEKNYKKIINLQKGHVYLCDLMRIEFANHCICQLLESFDNLIITEKIPINQLTKPQRQIYERCNNPLNWESMTRKQRYRNKIAFAAILEVYGQKRLKQTTCELLFNKAYELQKFA